MLLVPAVPIRRGTSLINTLRNLGLTSNLQVCLDAGDLNSYEGTSQTWKDLSGNGNDFYRGTGSGSDAADPTFTKIGNGGTYGDYFGYDGADRFTLAQSAPSWQSGMHKAGGAFTILQWAYVGNLTGLSPSQAGFGCGDSTSSASGGRTIAFTNSASTQNALSISVNGELGGGFLGNKSTLLVTNNAWQMIAVSVTVDTAAILFVVNGSSETRPNVFSGTPTANDSLVPLNIGAIAADGYASAINGCRIAATAIYTSALSAANLLSIFSATRSRFGV